MPVGRSGPGKALCFDFPSPRGRWHRGTRPRVRPVGEPGPGLAFATQGDARSGIVRDALSLLRLALRDVKRRVVAAAIDDVLRLMAHWAPE